MVFLGLYIDLLIATNCSGHGLHYFHMARDFLSQPSLKCLTFSISVMSTHRLKLVLDISSNRVPLHRLLTNDYSLALKIVDFPIHSQWICFHLFLMDLFQPKILNGSVSIHFKWICFNPKIWSISTTNTWICFNPFPMDLFQSDISMDLFQSNKIPWVSLNPIHNGSVSTLTKFQYI